jgi:hypothetical protein
MTIRYANQDQCQSPQSIPITISNPKPAPTVKNRQNQNQEKDPQQIQKPATGKRHQRIPSQPMQLSKNKTTGLKFPVAKRSRLARHQIELKTRTALGGATIYSSRSNPSTLGANPSRGKAGKLS